MTVFYYTGEDRLLEHKMTAAIISGKVQETHTLPSDSVAFGCYKRLSSVGSALVVIPLIVLPKLHKHVKALFNR